MKTYVVYADITMSVHTIVNAKNEEEAEELALQELNNNAFEYVKNADACGDVEVVEVSKIPSKKVIVV